MAERMQIKDWQVQQGYPIDTCNIKDNTYFYLTEKLNGVRATYYDGHMVSRTGKTYTGVYHIVKEIEAVVGTDMVVDGEITIKDKAGMSDNEAFRVAAGIVNSDAEEKTGLQFTIFDALSREDFDNDTSPTYSSRREYLNSIADKFTGGSVHVLPELYRGTDQSVIPSYLDQMVAADKEGLMLNLDVPYKRKRHKGILKIKRFYTMDLKIVNCEEGSGRLAGTLGAFVVDFHGNEVRVGSGFTDEQRAEFWRRRDELPDVLCEVKYKEISSDKKTGLQSLQFPIFISLREDKTEVSYG